MIKAISICFVLLFPTALMAEGESTIVMDPAQEQQFDAKMCIDRYANNCINTVCLTSEERDCIEKCRLYAKDKCQEKGITD